MDLPSALTQAEDTFLKRLEVVQPDMWVLPTPCPDWDVHYLVAHVIGGNRFAGLVLGGLSSADAISTVMSTQQISDSPMRDWRESVGLQRLAFLEADGRTARVDHPRGSITVSELLKLRVFELTMHAWDLARATDGEETLPAALVAAVREIVAAGPPGMGFGLEPLGLTTEASTAQATLLDLTGRV